MGGKNMKDKKNRCSKVAEFVVGSSVLIVAGFIFIPLLIQNYRNKAYKKL